MYYSETKNWLNGSASPVYGAGGYNYSRADLDYADSYTSYAYAFYEAEVQASVTLLNRDGSATSQFAYDGIGRLSNVAVGGPRASCPPVPPNSLLLPAPSPHRISLPNQDRKP